MSRYKGYGTPSRLKTDHFATTLDTSKFTTSSICSTAREHYQGSYYDISIQKSRISQRQGYLSRRKRQNIQKDNSLSKKQGKKYCPFKNYKQFQADLKVQHGMLNKTQPHLDVFGVATYRGLKKSINSHQISVHVGQPTALTLIEGYDGIFAASELKKNFSNQLLLGFRNKKNDPRQQPFRLAERHIKKALDNCKKKLKKSQQQRGDDSGASFLTLVVHQGVAFAVNCGSSQVLCMTKNGRLVQLAKPHTTANANEVQRIIKDGGQLYQTIVNFPYQKEMRIKGPLRIYPQGLTVTRTLGKTSSHQSRQKRVRTVSDFSSTKGVLSQPQLQFIPVSQIRWVTLLSSKIVQKIHQYRIRDIIEQQLAKKTKDDLQTEVVEYCCKRLILQTVQLGQTASLSAMLIFANLQEPVPQPPQEVPIKKRKVMGLTPKNDQTLNRQPRSLKYIGNRINFVEEENIL